MRFFKRMSVTTALIAMLALATACGDKKGANADAVQQQSTEAEAQQREMTPQERYEAMSVYQQEDVDSMDARITMDMDVSMGGESVKSVTEMRMTFFMEPLKARMEMNIDMDELGSQEMQIYIEGTEDNKGMMYIFDGTSWTVQESTDISAAMEQYDARGTFNVYVDGITDIKEVGKEKIDGRETVKLTGISKGEDMKESMLASGSLDSLSSVLDEEQLNSLFEGLENENSQIEFWVDAETNEMVKCTYDMTSAMNKIYENMSALIPEAGMELSVDKMVVSIDNISYNNAEDFEIPAEAKQ
ncbi:MAG: hypothetical protein PUI41_08315 [Lachnospiraceae bacterium]|nr:hypothetical protein [Lachnospiraceae bacterium]